MERTLSQEERVKRAEEIYYRRRGTRQDVRVASSQVNNGQEKKGWVLYRKMILQIFACIVIYVIFYVAKNNQYFFSQDMMNQAQAFLKTDINFEQITNQVNDFWNQNREKLPFWNQWISPKEENTEQENTNQTSNTQNSTIQQEKEDQNQTVQNSIEEKTNQTKTDANSAKTNVTNEQPFSKENQQTAGIGGASDEKTVTTSAEESSKKTQTEIDAEYIKKNFRMQLPVKGTITSHYGKRQATEIVSANHQGIDIGVVIGTTIVASMEGKVSVVSNEGEYGTHVKIVNQDVTTIYAHCSKILVKQGDTVKLGQKIALSGNTGKTTGPHLHFEIRRGTRTVDPELILKWA